MTDRGVIGRDNALPWRLPADLRRVRRLTTGHAIIMGRRNYESIGRPLPERRNIVLTTQHDYRAPGCIVVHSVDAALAAAGDDPEVFVFGGAEIYRQLLPRARRMYLTLVHAEIAGDRYFPEFDRSEWKEIEREDQPADPANPYPCSFVTLERVRPGHAPEPIPLS